MRCSPTLLSHAQGSRSLSFKIVPKPPPCEVFSCLVIACQGEQEPIIQNSPPTPTLWGVLLPCYRMPRGAGSYHSPQSPNSHPVGCSPTLLLHTKGSRELLFTQIPKPPPCEEFSYLAITYQQEQVAIIHPSPHTLTLWGVPLPCYYIPTGAWSYHSPKSPHRHPVRFFSYHAITYQGEQGAIIHQSPQTPTMWGVLLPCYYVPRVAYSYHSPKSPNPHPVRCSPTLLLHTKGSR